MTNAVNYVHDGAFRVRAVCECCGQRSRPVRPDANGEPNLWDMGRGWNCAPFFPDAKHADGSVGSFYKCPTCNMHLRAGARLVPRAYMARRPVNICDSMDESQPACEAKDVRDARGMSAPEGWRLVPVEPPMSLLRHLIGYDSVAWANDPECSIIIEELRARWTEILAALPDAPGLGSPQPIALVSKHNRTGHCVECGGFCLMQPARELLDMVKNYGHYCRKNLYVAARRELAAIETALDAVRAQQQHRVEGKS